MEEKADKARLPDENMENCSINKKWTQWVEEASQAGAGALHSPHRSMGAETVRPALGKPARRHDRPAISDLQGKVYIKVRGQTDMYEEPRARTNTHEEV